MIQNLSDIYYVNLLREKNCSYVEIAEALGYTEKEVMYYCQKNGLGGIRKFYTREWDTGKVESLVKEGKTHQEIADILGVTKGQVSGYCKQNKIKSNHGLSKDIQQEAISLYLQGNSMRNIGEKLGVNYGRIINFLVSYGLYEKDTSYKSEASTIERYKSYAEQNGFDYVGGFKDSESSLQIRCKECGSIKDVNAKTLRRKNGHKIVCDNCLKKEVEKRKELRNKQKQIEREQNKIEREQRRLEKRKEQEEAKALKLLNSKHICQICGKEYYSTRRTKYCSEECSFIGNKRRKDNRVNGKRKSNITWQKYVSITKDYHCALCGGLVDTNDYIKTDKTTICGNNYPSIDHIIPMSKGGTDTLDNVQLAHRGCNSRKINSLPKTITTTQLSLI